MTNEEKRLQGLAHLNPALVAKKLAARSKQGLENARVKEISKTLEEEILSELKEDEMILIYHVSHMLSRYGVPHFRSYDKKKYNGITIAFVSSTDGAIPTKVYAAFCDKEDTYSRSFGRLKVLTRIKKDLDNQKAGIKTSKFSPVIFDREAAFKYVDLLDGMSPHHSIVRASVDWYITNHVNKPKKQVLPVTFTRQQVLKAEKAVARRAEIELNNIADLRVVYEHEMEREGVSKLPRILKRIEMSGKKEPRDATTAKLILCNTEKNRNLPKEVVESLEEVLKDTKAKVYRLKGDQPNRVNARMFAIRKLAKTAF